MEAATSVDHSWSGESSPVPGAPVMPSRAAAMRPMRTRHCVRRAAAFCTPLPCPHLLPFRKIVKFSRELPRTPFKNQARCPPRCWTAASDGQHTRRSRRRAIARRHSVAASEAGLARARVMRPCVGVFVQAGRRPDMISANARSAQAQRPKSCAWTV